MVLVVTSCLLLILFISEADVPLPAEAGVRAAVVSCILFFFFFFQAEDGIRDDLVTGVQTCALPIYRLKAAIAEFAEPAAECANPDFTIPRLQNSRRAVVSQALLRGVNSKLAVAQEIGRASCRERV